MPVVAGIGMVAYYAGKRSCIDSHSAFCGEMIQARDAVVENEQKLNKLTGVFLYLVSDAMHNFNVGEDGGKEPDPKHNKRLRILFQMMRYISGRGNPVIFFNEIHDMVDISDELAKEIEGRWSQSDDFERKRIEYNIILLGLLQIEHYLYGGEPKSRNNPDTLDEFLNHMFLIKND